MAEKVLSLIDQVVAQRLRAVQPGSLLIEEVVPESVSETVPNSNGNVVGSNAIEVRKRVGDNNLVERSILPKLKTTEEKIELLIKLESHIPSNKFELTERARTWINQTLKPILSCFRTHHGSNLETFVQKYGLNFSHSRFSKGCRCETK